MRWVIINIAADHQMFRTLGGELSWQRLRRSAVDLYSKSEKNRSLSHPLGHLAVTYALRLWLVGKSVINFIFIVIELFSLSPTVETLWAAFFEGGGWVTLNADFTGKGSSPTNHSWYQSSRVIALSCMWYKNICSASFSFVTMHACDRQTDRRTDGRTDRITTPKTALAYARAVKTAFKLQNVQCQSWSTLRVREHKADDEWLPQWEPACYLQSYNLVHFTLLNV